MTERFVDSRTITVRPGDATPITIGPATLATGDDTLWVKVTSSSSGDCPWPWSFALLTWVTSEGRELGTAKIFGVCEGEVYRLGVGRTPLERSGVLKLEPRGFNLRWIELGNPWTLTFEYVSGQTGGGAGEFGGVVSNGFVDTSDSGLQLVQVSFPSP